MKELPILYSTPMVKALLQGRKTQTRRIIKPQPDEGEGDIGVGIFNPALVDRKGELYPGPDTFGAIADSGEYCVRCPYGQPGDKLWVRETWQKVGFNEPPLIEGYLYKANKEDDLKAMKWKSSRFMPKAAARIWLEVEEVRVERLQEIIPADVIAEGCPFTYSGFDPEQAPDWTGWYRDLWQSINGVNAWEQNPFVWVITFKRIEP